MKEETQDGPSILREYWTDYAHALAHPLRADELLGRFVANPNVTGAYAEAWIRDTVRTMLPKFAVSTGTIIRVTDRRESLKVVPQCDLIIWDPSDLPALFQKGDFAVVPAHAVRGLVEIKRTCSDLGAFEEQLLERQRRMLEPYRKNILGVVLSHSKRLFEDTVEPNWLFDVIKSKQQPRITRLFASNSWEPDADGIFALIYFLSALGGNRWPHKAIT